MAVLGLRCGARASHCGVSSCCRARALGTQASVVVARGLSSCGLRALERRLSSCGAGAQLLRGMWDLPRPGLKPMSPALAGGFLTTAPPGKSQSKYFLITIFYILVVRSISHKSQATVAQVFWQVMSALWTSFHIYQLRILEWNSVAAESIILKSLALQTIEYYLVCAEHLRIKH